MKKAIFYLTAALFSAVMLFGCSYATTENISKQGSPGGAASDDPYKGAGAVPHPCALSDGRARTDSDTRTNPDAGADSDALYRRMA